MIKLQNIAEILKNNLKKSVFGVFFFIIFIWQISLTPESDKNWRSENSKLSTVNFLESDFFEIHNFRDFYFDKALDEIQENWIDVKKFKFSKLENVALGVSYFAEFKGVAHTFLNFKFKNGDNFSYSIEMRLEEDEEFSPWKGLMRQNEIYMAIGTDRDILGRRVGIKDEKLFLYNLNLSPEKRREVLVVVLENINELSIKPRFYNTLIDNCTTSLVAVAEEVKGRNILWTLSHLMPGYFDEKAFNLGLLKNSRNLEFDEFKKNHQVLSDDF